MNTPRVQHGWRMQCVHHNCQEYWHEWASSQRSGPPPFPWFDKKDVPSVDGWFFSMVNNNHIAYCPHHSEPALVWWHALRAWRSMRQETATKVRLSIPLPFSLRATLLTRERNKKIQKAVAKWQVDFPKPLPPWALNNS